MARAPGRAVGAHAHEVHVAGARLGDEVAERGDARRAGRGSRRGIACDSPWRGGPPRGPRRPSMPARTSARFRARNSARRSSDGARALIPPAPARMTLTRRAPDGSGANRVVRPSPMAGVCHRVDRGGRGCVLTADPPSPYRAGDRGLPGQSLGRRERGRASSSRAGPRRMVRRMTRAPGAPGLGETLRRHVPADGKEAADVAEVLAFLDRHPDPFDRRILEGHLTASAVVVSAAGDRVLLLHHRKLGRWLQPGGHAEPGEGDAERIALREAWEETGIPGLVLHPSAPRPLDVDVHPIPARGDEPAHRHLDLRYLVVAPRTGCRASPPRRPGRSGGSPGRSFRHSSSIPAFAAHSAPRGPLRPAPGPPLEQGADR